MYILLDACKHPTILRVLYFAYLFWEIVAVVIPIGLILMLMIDFTKAVVINKEDEQVKSMKLVGKRIMYAVFIFATPWLVSFIMNILATAGVEVGSDYTLCINIVKRISAGTDDIERYDKLLEIEEAADENEQNNNKDNNGGDSGGSSSVSGSTTADKMINVASGELSKTDGTKYGAGSGDAWCAYFTTWVLKNTKMDNGKSIYAFIGGNNSLISDGAASGTWAAFKSGVNGVSFNKAKAYGGRYTPKKGDVLYFQWNDGYCRRQNRGNDWDGSKQCSDHVGIVRAVRDGIVYTIEGNSGGKVSAKEYPIDTKQIIAYGSWYK